MKYYKISTSNNINGIVPSGLDGANVKNKEDFFDKGKCGPDRFYDQMYEFDYLVPHNFGDWFINDTPTVAIYDYHLWHGESPWGGWLKPVSKNFKEVLEQFNLGEHRFYPAKVLFRKKKHSYFVMQIKYHLYHQYIDFESTIFNNLNSSRQLCMPELVAKKFSSIPEVEAYSKNNWDWDYNFERIVMQPEFRKLDFLTFFKLGDIVSERLKNAIEEAGLIGIEFKELPIPIEFSDEI